ncbi:hypothetical protein [Amycolatopsis sp. 195334CR]|uniref:hypothetical protein n=1 Tax=Amycolatopsis sp. 195334CR TaxID=2814588 RepID=UPI001A8FD23E|nr:hypothetical protein [Amycolatopsis sp. 195334CR]MBN6035370.1 hypothetical protein [Amycolatopsis sp. 195334CR]
MPQAEPTKQGESQKAEHGKSEPRVQQVAERPRRVVEKVVRKPVIVQAAAQPSVSAEATSTGPSAKSYAIVSDGTKTVIAESGKPVVVQQHKPAEAKSEKKAEGKSEKKGEQKAEAKSEKKGEQKAEKSAKAAKAAKLDKAVAKLDEAEQSVSQAEKSLSHAKTKLAEAKGEVDSIRKDLAKDKKVKIKLPGKIDVSPEVAKKLRDLAQQK